MAHAPHDPERVIEKAFLVQRLIDTNECRAWLRDPALIAIWGREPIATVSELIMLAPEINEIASRLAHNRYQPLKANHYRAQHARHWQAQEGHTTQNDAGSPR